MLWREEWLQGLDDTPATGVYRSGLSGASFLTWIQWLSIY